MESFIEAVTRDYNRTAIPRAPRGTNLTRVQSAALEEIHKDPRYTIKRADKGGATTIFNTIDDVREGYRQLSDLGLVVGSIDR